MIVKKKIPKACYKKLIMKQKLIKLSALKFNSYLIHQKQQKASLMGKTLWFPAEGLAPKYTIKQQKQAFLREAT